MLRKKIPILFLVHTDFLYFPEKIVFMDDQTGTINTPSYGKSSLWQKILLYLVIGAAAYGLIYYFVIAKNNAGAPLYTPPSGSQTTTNNSVSETNSNPQVLSVMGNEFAFTPSSITVKANQPVQINFSNTGNFPHNLDIAELGVKSKTVEAGQSDTMTFTPSTPGRYSFICSVPGHAEKGMKGTLIVQ